MLNSNSRFSSVVAPDIERSRIKRPHSHKTTFNAAELVPIYCKEIVPGDTVSMDVSSLVRMSTPLYPVMDQSWLDIHFFFVPNRLVWSSWKQFMGENDDPWAQSQEFFIPVAELTGKVGGFYDHIGVPPGIECEVSALPYRAYQLIWNEWYRDENLQYSIPVYTLDGRTVIDEDDDLLSVNKYKDYFTSALPSPQKGDPVTIPLGSFAPVTTRNEVADSTALNSTNSLRWKFSPTSATSYNLGVFGVGGVGNTVTTPNSAGSDGSAKPINLWADLQDVSAITVNQLREAFAVQRLLERDARAGSRYRELVLSHFGVTIPDNTVQVPEYLGGQHIPINVSQVIQQSASLDEPTPLGNTGAFSKTVNRGSLFTKSFVEHGILIGVASVRTDHSYSQGIPRWLLRSSKYDFYWPELANIGEQPVYLNEIYATDFYDNRNVVFGYQEAWADYRYSPNMITGAFRPGIPGSLDVWHYGDYYSSRPSLSSGWVQETDQNIARTLAVQDSELADQFIADFYFDDIWARPIPLYSIPGLGSHF